MYGISPMDL